MATYTAVSGTTLTGLYARDGSFNVVFDDTVYRGVYHPCGAYRVNSDTSSTKTYDPSGALYLRNFLNGNPSVAAPSPSPGGYHWEFVTDATAGFSPVTDATINQPVVSLVRN